MVTATQNFENHLSIKEVKDAYDFMSKAQDVAKKMAANYNLKKSAFERKNEHFKNTGSLKLSRIANYKTSDEIFHNKMEVRQASNHGLVLILDFSGSMSDMLYNVAQQFLVTALYCKIAKIKFEAFGFTSSGSRLLLSYLANSTLKISDIKEVYLRIVSYYIYENFRYGKKDSTFSTFTTQMKKYNHLDLVGDMSGTPLHEATIEAYHKAMLMKHSGVENVSIVFVTDGSASDRESCSLIKDFYSNNFIINDNCYNYLTALNKLIRLQNIKIFNVFLGDISTQKEIDDRLIDVVIGYYDSYKMQDEIPANELKRKLHELVRTTSPEALYIENFCGYNSFIAIHGRTDKSDEMSYEQYRAESILENRFNEISKFAFIGKYINELVCEDFA